MINKVSHSVYRNIKTNELICLKKITGERYRTIEEPYTYLTRTFLRAEYKFVKLVTAEVKGKKKQLKKRLANEPEI